MKLAGKVAVVTGGAGGIGRALCRRFAAEGARAVVVTDLDGAAASVVAAEIGGMGFEVNVARESDLALLVREVIAEFGQIDLFCSNAGIMVEGGPEAADADWQRIWDINVMAHVFAARAVLPGMLERREWVFVADGFCGWVAHSDRFSALLCDETCGAGICRVAGDYLLGSRD